MNIRIKNEKSWDMEIEDKEDWLRHDDKLYSKLSNMIMNEMEYKLIIYFSKLTIIRSLSQNHTDLVVYEYITIHYNRRTTFYF